MDPRIFLPGLGLCLLALAMTPARLSPQASPVAGPPGTLWMNVRLFQVSLLLAGCWLLLVSSRRPGLWGYLVPPLFLALMGFYFRYGIVDDTYISLRYARNLSRGLGLVYNAGERVEGYTCFLWVLILGLVHRLTGADLVAASVGGSILSGAGAILLASRLLPAQGVRGGRPALLLLMAANLPLVFWSFSGMETSLQALLLTAAVLLVFRHWRRPHPGRLGPAWAGLLFGLAAWNRPETWLSALVAAVAVASSAPGRRRLRETALFLAPFLLLTAGQIVFRLAYYGDPLPNTYYTKVDGFSWSLVRYGAAYLRKGLVWHLPLVLLGAAAFLPRPKAPRSPDSGARLQDPGDAAEAPHSTFRERGFLAAMILSQVAVILYTGADHFEEMRFFVPVLPLLLALAAIGLTSLTRSLPSLSGAGRSWTAGGLVLGAALASLFLSFFVGLVGYKSSLLYGHALTQRWAVLGEFLRTEAGPTDLLATPVAGAMPYVADLPTLDMLGLTDRTIAHKKVVLGGLWKDHEKFDLDYVLSRRPRWIFLAPYEVGDEAGYVRRPFLPVGAELARRLPLKGYDLVSGSYRRVGYTFLRRRD